MYKYPCEEWDLETAPLPCWFNCLILLGPNAYQIIRLIASTSPYHIHMYTPKRGDNISGLDRQWEENSCYFIVFYDTECLEWPV